MREQIYGVDDGLWRGAVVTMFGGEEYAGVRGEWEDEWRLAIAYECITAMSQI